MCTSHWLVSIIAVLIFISSSPMTGRKYGQMRLWVTMSKCLDLFSFWAKLLGTAGKTLPPLSSNYFSAAQATPVKKVKGDKSEASTAPPPSPTPAPHLSREQPFLPMYPPMQAIPYAMPFPMYHPSMAMPSPYYPGFFPPHNPGDTLHAQEPSKYKSGIVCNVLQDFTYHDFQLAHEVTLIDEWHNYPWSVHFCQGGKVACVAANLH